MKMVQSIVALHVAWSFQRPKPLPSSVYKTAIFVSNFNAKDKQYRLSALYCETSRPAVQPADSKRGKRRVPGAGLLSDSPSPTRPQQDTNKGRPTKKRTGENGAREEEEDSEAVSKNWHIWVGNNSPWILFFHSFPLSSLCSMFRYSTLIQ